MQAIDMFKDKPQLKELAGFSTEGSVNIILGIHGQNKKHTT